MRVTRAILLVVIVGTLIPIHAWGHGFAGRRFFPATLTFDDPFVLDEFGFTGNRLTTPADGGGNVTTSSLSVDFAKRITKPLMFAVGTAVTHVNPSNGRTHTGLDNTEVGLKYLTYVSPHYESLIATGFYADVGGTGSASIGAEDFSTITPSLFFGQGLGRFLDSVPYLRPVAITGVAQPNFPLDHRQADTLTWGFSVQYNIEYLEDMVDYIGIDRPFKGLIPIVEFSMNSCLNRACGGQTTGTVNPGFIWWGGSGQIGVEAAIPVNHESGTGVGLVVQVDLYLDDLFPHSLGIPIF